MTDASARPSASCPWCGTVVASPDVACPNCWRPLDVRAWVDSCHAQAEGLAPPGWEGFATDEPLNSVANVTGYLRRELAALRILGENGRGEFWLERANELYANIFRALSALRICDRPEQLPKTADCDEAERRLDELWRRLAAKEENSSGSIGQSDSGIRIKMPNRSPYTVKTLLLYLADLERREQTARDLPESGGDPSEDPGLLMSAGIAVSRRELRKWPDVQRILRDCEAAGHTFDTAGMSQWVALVCKARRKLPDDVAGWNLDAFCDLADQSGGIGATVDDLRARLMNPDISDAIAGVVSAVNRPGQASSEPRGNQSADVGFLGGTELADALGIHATRRVAFFRQLERQRISLGDGCWHEVRDPRPNSPRFLYRVDSSKLRELAADYKNPKPA